MSLSERLAKGGGGGGGGFANEGVGGGASQAGACPVAVVACLHIYYSNLSMQACPAVMLAFPQLAFCKAAHFQCRLSTCIDTTTASLQVAQLACLY